MQYHVCLNVLALHLQDFDYYEIHEAFASQVLSTLKAWEDPKFCKERLGLDAPLGSIDRAKLNVKGSSLAAGHPFCCNWRSYYCNCGKTIEPKRFRPCTWYRSVLLVVKA